MHKKDKTMAKRGGTTRSTGSSSAGAGRTASGNITLRSVPASGRTFKFGNGIVAEVHDQGEGFGFGSNGLRGIRIEAWIPATSTTPLNKLGFFTFQYSNNAEEREAERLFTKQEAIKQAQKQLKELSNRKPR